MSFHDWDEDDEEEGQSKKEMKQNTMRQANEMITVS
jgi:hypothetical protein